MADKYRFTVDEARVRLDVFVARKCPDLSRTYAQKLIADGLVTVNGRIEKPGTRLNAGDIVEVESPQATTPVGLASEAIAVPIVYEDNDLLVVDKPPGLTVHPAPGSPLATTLVNALLAHIPDLAGIGEPLRPAEGEPRLWRPGIVHRLDKDTSGLMVVAKNERAHRMLSEQIKSRAIEKRYLTLVEGHLTPRRGTIDAPIGRDPRNRKRMAVVAKGREARTDYEVMKYLDDYTLVEIRPETGRTHQIRVHLSAIGHPIVGDPVYGRKSELVGRQFLHASRLGFRLPSTGEWVEFSSELPQDLRNALERLTVSS